MIKRILIPTDLHVESLITAKLALMANQANQVVIILVYPFRLDDSITDLLFYSPNKILKKSISPQFEEGLSVLKNGFDKTLLELHIKLFHGYAQGAFNNLLEAEKIDEIYCPEKYCFKVKGQTFDCSRFFSNSGLPIHTVSWRQDEISGSDELTKLFI